jgi:quercetin dioxygenase-like cupin family protein
VSSQLRQPHAPASNEGPTFWVLGLSGCARAAGEHTGITLSLVEAHCPPGYATPLHVHDLEDEAVYVLEGHLTFYSGGLTIPAVPGTYIYQPRGLAHGFRVQGASAARILCMTVPAGSDQRAPDISQASLLGPAILELETPAALAARYRIDVRGPLPAPTAHARVSEAFGA